MAKNKHIFDLPEDVIGEIVLRLADINYDSIYRLAQTCQYFNRFCTKFMLANPRIKFIKPTVDYSDSDDSDYLYDDSNEPEYESLDDDLDLDCLSYGSNYDEGLDEYLNGPDRDYDAGY